MRIGETWDAVDVRNGVGLQRDDGVGIDGPDDLVPIGWFDDWRLYVIGSRSHAVDQVDKLLPGQMPGIDSDRDIVSSIDDELGDGVPVRQQDARASRPSTVNSSAVS